MDRVHLNVGRAESVRVTLSSVEEAIVREKEYCSEKCS
jgi:hypothetical protein